MGEKKSSVARVVIRLLRGSSFERWTHVHADHIAEWKKIGGGTDTQVELPYAVVAKLTGSFFPGNSVALHHCWRSAEYRILSRGKTLAHHSGTDISTGDPDSPWGAVTGRTRSGNTGSAVERTAAAVTSLQQLA